MRMKKKPLALWIFTGLALGIVAGMLLMSRPDIAEMYIKPFGTLFLNLLTFRTRRTTGNSPYRRGFPTRAWQGAPFCQSLRAS